MAAKASKKSRAEVRSEADDILAEIVGTVSLPILLSGKDLHPDALTKWNAGLLQSIQNQLISGAKWAGKGGARETVLSVAMGMGTIATILAHRAKTVEKRHIEAAFEAVKVSGMCSMLKPHTRGLWCDF